MRLPKSAIHSPQKEMFWGSEAMPRLRVFDWANFGSSTKV
jgi:hypothetical protein